MLRAWMNRRRYRKVWRGAERKTWEPEIRAHIDALDRYQNDVEKPARRARRLATASLCVGVVGFGAFAFGIGLLGWLNFPLIAPPSVVALFSTEKADLWKKARETRCHEPLLEWRAAEFLGEDSFGWRAETWRCIGNRQKRGA